MRVHDVCFTILDDDGDVLRIDDKPMLFTSEHSRDEVFRLISENIWDCKKGEVAVVSGLPEFLRQVQTFIKAGMLKSQQAALLNEIEKALDVIDPLD